MKKRHKISKEIKDQILDRIKNEGVSVAKAAEEHGVSTYTIYGWISRRTAGEPSVLETAKLRRENQALKELIGEITLQMSRTQKKN